MYSRKHIGRTKLKLLFSRGKWSQIITDCQEHLQAILEVNIQMQGSTYGIEFMKFSCHQKLNIVTKITINLHLVG